MRTDELDFHLPPELIAQEPPAERVAARLMHYCRADGVIAHRSISNLPQILRRGDLLVFNDARVVPARFMLHKETGGRVEGLFLEEPSPGRWRVLLKNAGRDLSRPFHFAATPAATARVIERLNEGECLLEVEGVESAVEFLARFGRMPLPPYIKRDKDKDERDDLDRGRYQTVFAATAGAVAAPTAGLHFSQALLAELESAGVERAFVTLHVGLGTFKPVTAERLEDHAMHEEAYAIPRATADAINRAKKEQRRVIAVGTTAARVLESQPADRSIAPIAGRTSIFIKPPYGWKHVDALLTNFHLPRSTLIALVAAMVGLEAQRRLYEAAIAERYRFFSYGDAMFIE